MNPIGKVNRKENHHWPDRDGTLSNIHSCDVVEIMAKSKRKPPEFTAGREARRRARELAGPPPAERVIPDKRLKPPKHKKKLLEDNGR
jgi:hypothetical protein